MATDTVATATTRLHDLGQSLWLDNITRWLLTSGTLRRYIDEWSRIVPELTDVGEPSLAHDSSTNTLIRRYRQSQRVD